jgi:hypothetical protein
VIAGLIAKEAEADRGAGEIVQDHMTEAWRQALAIANNRIGVNASRDDQFLRSELATLQEAGFDLGPIGFGQTALDRILAGVDGWPRAAVVGPELARAPATITTAVPTASRSPNVSASRPSRSSSRARVGGRIASARARRLPMAEGCYFNPFRTVQSFQNGQSLVRPDLDAITRFFLE